MLTQKIYLRNPSDDEIKLLIKEVGEYCALLGYHNSLYCCFSKMHKASLFSDLDESISDCFCRSIFTFVKNNKKLPSKETHNAMSVYDRKDEIIKMVVETCCDSKGIDSSLYGEVFFALCNRLPSGPVLEALCDLRGLLYARGEIMAGITDKGDYTKEFKQFSKRNMCSVLLDDPYRQYYLLIERLLKYLFIKVKHGELDPNTFHNVSKEIIAQLFEVLSKAKGPNDYREYMLNKYISQMLKGLAEIIQEDTIASLDVLFKHDDPDHAMNFLELYLKTEGGEVLPNSDVSEDERQQKIAGMDLNFRMGIIRQICASYADWTLYEIWVNKTLDRIFSGNHPCFPNAGNQYALYALTMDFGNMPFYYPVNNVLGSEAVLIDGHIISEVLKLIESEHCYCSSSNLIDILRSRSDSGTEAVQLLIGELEKRKEYDGTVFAKNNLNPLA